MIFTVEKHTTPEYIVMASNEGGYIKQPIAKCNSETDAQTIKAFYEKADREAKIEESDNQLHGQ